MGGVGEVGGVGGAGGGVLGRRGTLLKGRHVAGRPRWIDKPPKNKGGEVLRPHQVCRVSVLRFFFFFLLSQKVARPSLEWSGVDESSMGGSNQLLLVVFFIAVPRIFKSTFMKECNNQTNSAV